MSASNPGEAELRKLSQISVSLAHKTTGKRKRSKCLGFEVSNLSSEFEPGPLILLNIFHFSLLTHLSYLHTVSDLVERDDPDLVILIEKVDMLT